MMDRVTTASEVTLILVEFGASSGADYVLRPAVTLFSVL